MIAVVSETGGTNLNSISYALTRLEAPWTLTADPAVIRAAERVILPGVGAARASMERLAAAGLVDLIRSLTQPVLGVCLGMQILFRESAEGNVACLDLIDGVVQGMNPSPEYRIPHMGWNTLVADQPDHWILAGVRPTDGLYFVHSYQAAVGPYVVASTEHGGPVPAIVQQRNFIGCQFHPEKSAKPGMTILQNFLKWEGP